MVELYGMDINHIARLAKLKIADKDAAKLEKELESIIGFVQQLSEVETTDVQPTGHAIALSNIVGQDINTNQDIRSNGDSVFRDQLLSNTKKVKDGLIVTPKILE